MSLATFVYISTQIMEIKLSNRTTGLRHREFNTALLRSAELTRSGTRDAEIYLTRNSDELKSIICRDFSYRGCFTSLDSRELVPIQKKLNS